MRGERRTHSTAFTFYFRPCVTSVGTTRPAPLCLHHSSGVNERKPEYSPSLPSRLGCRRKGGEGLTGFAGQPGKDQEVVVVGGGSLGGRQARLAIQCAVDLNSPRITRLAGWECRRQSGSETCQRSAPTTGPTTKLVQLPKTRE